MTVREAIAAAVRDAVATRGAYGIALERDRELSLFVEAAVDGSLELTAAAAGPRRGLLRRREPLDASALGFVAEVLVLPAQVARGATATLERLVTGPWEADLDESADLWQDRTGVLPGGAMPAATASHADHLEAAARLFDHAPDGDLIVYAGAPNRCVLQAVLDEEGRIDAAIEELAGWSRAPLARAGFGAAAAALLHDRVGVLESDPLFLELGYDF